MMAYLLPAAFIAMFVGAALGRGAAIVAFVAVAISGLVMDGARARR